MLFSGQTLQKLSRTLENIKMKSIFLIHPTLFISYFPNSLWNLMKQPFPLDLYIYNASTPTNNKSECQYSYS